MGTLAEQAKDAFPAHFFDTMKLRALGLFQIPLLLFLAPKVIELGETRCVIEIPLTWRSKNHLGAMYFGSLAAGADCAGGIIAWATIEKVDPRIKLVFKDFNAVFLKRAESHVRFTCEDGAAVKELVLKAAKSGEREEMTVNIVATAPKTTGDEPVARFKLTLSLKRKESVKGKKA